MRVFWLLLALGFTAQAQDLSALLKDRRAIEEVYHAHRTGAKLSFEETIRPEDLRHLVEVDLRKEKVLKQAYGVKIGDAEIQAETDRITRTTRAPEVLSELRAALGNDPARFARTVVKPLLVDRKLRECYENDARLHSDQRQAAEIIRADLLKARQGQAGVAEQLRRLQSAGSGILTQKTWSLATKEAMAEPSPQAPSLPSLTELSPQLRTVLLAQLRSSGDVSAVIEAPSEFLLFLAQNRTDLTLSTACLAIPKPSFESWLKSFGRNLSSEPHARDSAQ